jgi:hypothetical protein
LNIVYSSFLFSTTSLRISSHGDRIAGSGQCSSQAKYRSLCAPTWRISISQVAGRLQPLVVQFGIVSLLYQPCFEGRMGTDCRKYVLLDLDMIALTVVVERVCKEILSVHQCTVDLFQ